MNKQISLRNTEYQLILDTKTIEINKFLSLLKLKNIEEFNFTPFYKLFNIDTAEWTIIDCKINRDLIKIEPKQLILDDFDTFIFDLGGTILNDNKGIEPKNLEAIHFLASKGKKIGIATAGAIFMLHWYFDKLPCNLPFLCVNGGMIHDCKTHKLISDFVIDHNDAAKLMNKCDELNLGYYVFWEGGIVGMNVENSQDFKDKNYKKILKPEHWVLNPDKSFFKDKKICKIFATFDPHQKNEIVKLDEYVKGFPHLFGMQTQRNFYDVGKITSKALALQSIASEYNIDFKRTVSFGDSNSDSLIFESTALSFAPKNSMHLAMQNATFVSNKTSNEDWLAEIIYQFK